MRIDFGVSVHICGDPAFHMGKGRQMLRMAGKRHCMRRDGMDGMRRVTVKDREMQQIYSCTGQHLARTIIIDDTLMGLEGRTSSSGAMPV
jgi:hypothetical protein